MWSSLLFVMTRELLRIIDDRSGDLEWEFEAELGLALWLLIRVGVIVRWKVVLGIMGTT